MVHLRDLESNRRLTNEHGMAAHIDVVHGSFEDISEPAGSFDVVWSQEAICHSTDMASVFREAWRVLRPGGQDGDRTFLREGFVNTLLQKGA